MSIKTQKVHKAKRNLYLRPFFIFHWDVALVMFPWEKLYVLFLKNDYSF